MRTEVHNLTETLLSAGLEPLEESDQQILVRIARRVQASRSIDSLLGERVGLRERLADRLAAIGGSWSFLAGFATVLLVWIAINGTLLSGRAFDPYPFVFLNFLLSILGAVQAPLILMSQNRQAAKDRLATALDYAVNLKAEMSIAELQRKLDQIQAQIGRTSTTERMLASPADASRLLLLQ
jgi:uncharacterized membrane protein